MKLTISRFALATSATIGLFHLLFSLALTFLPHHTFSLLAHAHYVTNYEKYVADIHITALTFVTSLVFHLVAGYILGGVFAFLYNKFTA
jgi:hypothetical protein